MTKKQVIRLTESDLRKIIKESVNNVLNERTKSEQGLTDDEVSNRRDIKFANEFEPEYGDSIYDDEQERHRNMIHNARIMNHYQTQNHKTKMREGKGWVNKSVNKVLKENDDFQPTSHRYTPSWSDENRQKIEMQVTNDRKKARFKDCSTNTISDWLDVQFDEEKGYSYVVDKNGRRENLCNFVLYHFCE